MAERGVIKVNIVKEGAAVIVVPEGDIGYHEAPSFKQFLKSGLDQKPAKLVVDLAGVPYMATPGVATLVEALQGTKKQQISLVLCGMSDRVRAIFEIARLHTVFTIVTSRSDALG